VTDTLTIGDLRVTIRRSDRRATIDLTVERDGSLTVRAPMAAEDHELARLVRSREVWIYSKLAEKEMLLRAWKPKEYVAGEGFMYLGRRYRLRLVDDPAAPDVRFTSGWFEMRRDVVEAGADVFARWYADRAREWLAARAHRHGIRAGVVAKPIEVRDLGYRWGSCGVRRLHFHWRVMTLPPRIIDYVIVHELAHVNEPHHKAPFWERVRQMMPDFEQRRTWLAVHGAEA
jgi:predicted metal-dependent hydrolase